MRFYDDTNAAIGCDGQTRAKSNWARGANASLVVLDKRAYPALQRATDQNRKSLGDPNANIGNAHSIFRPYGASCGNRPTTSSI